MKTATSLPIRRRRQAGPARARRERAKVLTREQHGMVLAALPEQYRLFFTFLAQTGLRISEAIGLQWQHVELGTHAHVRPRQGQLYAGHPCASARRRVGHRRLSGRAGTSYGAGTLCHVSLLRVIVFVAGFLLAGISAVIIVVVAIAENHPSTVGWVVLSVLVVLGVGISVGAARLRAGRKGGNAVATKRRQGTPNAG